MCLAFMRLLGRYTRIMISRTGEFNIAAQGVYRFEPQGEDVEQHTHIKHVESGTVVTCYQQH